MLFSPSSGRVARFSLLPLMLLASACLPDASVARDKAVAAPAPLIDAKETGRSARAIFAGGCFWGVEGVFSHMKGVKSVRSGYAGGPVKVKPDYDSVSSGSTGFAEAVEVIYDPTQVSYGTLMRVFFSVIADPTTLNYQGPDHGTQYRSALYPIGAEQTKAARAYLAQLGKARLWSRPIVTAVEAPGAFHVAEGYHQDFMVRNPRHGYIVAWDAPKLAALKAMYPPLVNSKAAP
jgi:peptide-methionine (S)-S-oxide reductase